MSREKVNKDLLRFKNAKIQGDVPDDLKVAVEAFLEQAVIIGEYNLDYMPHEYLENLLDKCAKYPKHAKQFNILGEHVAHSRIVAKAHYPSDKQFGRVLAERLFFMLNK